MSTEENKAVLRRNLEIFNKGNLEIADETIATNYILHGPAGQEYNGPEGFKQMITMYRTAFPDFHVTIEDMVAEGDKLAHRIILQGTHKGDLMGIAPTGKQVTLSAITISHFAGGKEVEAWSNSDLLDMYQQLGIAPPMG